MKNLLLLALIGLAGCSPKPTAADVCKTIVGTGLATNCREGDRKMLTARSSHLFDFDLTHVKGKGGAVMSFDTDEDYDATIKAFTAAAMLAGPHRYGNAKSRIFVQANDGLSSAEGTKLKAVIDGL